MKPKKIFPDDLEGSEKAHARSHHPGYVSCESLPELLSRVVR